MEPWSAEERELLGRLGRALLDQGARSRIDALADRAANRLAADPEAPHAWEPIPLEAYRDLLPEQIRSSWVFVLRGGTATGAERHPNSHQRMISYRGRGDFQTWEDGAWQSHHLRSEIDGPLESRWISIPVNVYHQGVCSAGDWVVISFHTVPVEELIEERGDPGGTGPVASRHYEKSRSSE